MGHHQTEGTAKRICYQLYVILDDYSRNVVGGMIAERESAKLATKLFEQTIARHRIDHGHAGEIVAHRTTVLALAHQSR